MRQYFTFFTIFFVFFLISCNSTSQVQEEKLPAPKTQHEGKWTGTDLKGNNVAIKMTQEGTGDVFINGASVKNQLNAVSCLYVIDYKQNPVSVQFIFMTKYFDVTEMNFLFDFLGPKMARIWSNFDATMPQPEPDAAFIVKRSF